MRPTTPDQERYIRFSRPPPQCPWFDRLGEDHFAHRSWTGNHTHIEWLRCSGCGREFSARYGTLMARSTLPEATVERRLKWQRWVRC
jgi:hypothetical protein